MRIVLRSLSHPKLDVLSIADELCLIGRDTPPFASVRGAASAGLAVQHACIFRKENEFYLIDFGTGSATLLNGRALPPKYPTKLANDDELGFAGIFKFRVERDSRGERGAVPSPMAPVQLALLPAPDSVGGEAIAIHGVPPLLIGRDMLLSAPAEDANAVPAAIKPLSRCHALLFLRGDSLHVMDLGSTNGTWRGTERIPPYTALPVGEGDTLAFGTLRLSYTVQIRRTDDDRAVNQEPDLEETANSSGIYAVGRTVYIKKGANSFLKMLADHLDETPAEPAREKANLAPPASQKPMGKARAFIRELRAALGNERPRHRAWLAGGSVAVVLAVMALYFHNAPQREIKALIEQGDYRAGLLQASEYLNQHPGDAEMSSMALKALVKETVPGWQTEIETGHFAAAADRLRKTPVQAIPESGALLGLLEWIGDLQSFLSERGGRDAPLKLFQDEQAISALLARWNAVARDYELLSLKIADWVPDFQNLRRRVLSQQRLLRNEQAVYLKAITTLEQSLRQLLARGNADEALASLERFALQYPRIVGLAPLRADIVQFETLQRAARDQDLGNLVDWREVAFTTPWVRETATQWLEEQLPPAEVLEHYQTALAAWKVGNIQQAIALLKPLLQERGGLIVAAKLEHFQQVADAFEQLSAARGQPDYGERLLGLSHTLHPSEDRFFLDALADDLRLQRQTLSTRAKALFQQADSHWKEYRRRGGISGLMRLEQSVSRSFKQQTRRLTQAYEAASAGARLHDLLRQADPETTRKLYEDILAETRRQRQSLADLRLVMKSTLLDAKLQLLPDPRTLSP
ncbi:MAG: FHA domain-containing protein [Candidatus Competibacteraceae bacterium]|nr:MAG: FHA domain-containing protein [Candidatus Competibacteraceae bacterium]